ncbi:uncharacterized protein [Halyomorpha halys]|uniref:uncharacterized protein n=1 Tax=Halyomorpha halys TaxID=286706 RepID=UPI0034D30A53
MPSDWEEDYDMIRNDLRRAEVRYRKIRAQRDTIAQGAKPVFPSPTYSSQLPNIRIPEFDGELSSWPRFRDTFVALVHKTQLAPVNKMHYLKNVLSGEPASLLAGFSFDASSYQPAWDAVVREYNNPRVLASRCLQRVLNHKCPTSGGERAKYASYLAEVAEGIESFRGLALEDESDVILSTLDLRALDPVTRRHFELAHARSDFPTVDDIIAFVRQRLMACKLSHELDMQPHSDAPRAKPAGRGKGGISFLASEVGTKERVSPGPSGSPPRRTSPGNSGRSGRRRSPGTSSRGKSVSPGKEPCSRCNGRHLLSRCYIFLALTPQERQNFVKSSDLRRICLRSGHHASKCHSDFTCSFCRDKHHSMLHVESRSGSPTAVPKSADFVGNTRATSGPHDCCSEAVMGTACAILHGSKHSAPTRLLLDSGSQYTFVTAELAASCNPSTEESPV